MARMTSAQRREAIVVATLAVMRRKGLGATTVRDVADELGCSSGLVHHYFESMDELLAEAFEMAVAADLRATEEAVTAGSEPTDQLRRFIATYSRAESDWSFQLWLDVWAEAARRPAIGRTSRRLNVAWQALLVDLIDRGVAAEEFTCTDSEATAWTLLSLIDGLALQAVAHPGSIERGRVIVWAAATAERELGLPPGALSPVS